MKWWLLVGRDLFSVDTIDEWLPLWSEDMRRVKLDEVSGWRVSTVFFGFAIRDDQLFETAIFDAEGSVVDLWRSGTLDDAENLHGLAVAFVKHQRSVELS